MMEMERALRREAMQAALRKVVKNKGAPGPDGLTVGLLESHCRQHWPAIKEALLNDTYKPGPVRSVEIPKPSGRGFRTLGIPNVVDRLIGQALLQTLSAIFDPAFSESSFGFRPGRSQHDAIVQAQAHIASGYRWCVKLDIDSFFDRVNHDVLMARVARRVKDKRVLRLLRRFLQAGIMQDSLTSPRTEGTPQGSPLSPLLSNILLDDLDRELERRGHRFCRYGDDVVVFVRSNRAGERVLKSLEVFLSKRLRLTLNVAKSSVTRPWEVNYLGYSFTVHDPPKLRIPKVCLRRLKRKLRPQFRRGRGRTLECTIEALNTVLKGWHQYYRKVQTGSVFQELDMWIRRKLRCLQWRHWKSARTRFNRLQKLGLSRSEAAFAAWNGQGPWRNAGSHAMHRAMPNYRLRKLGLMSLFQTHQRQAFSS